MNETYKTGMQINRRHAVITRKNGSAGETANLFVSTRKDGDIVLLRLECSAGT